VVLTGKIPSESAQTENYTANQSNPTAAILDGRYTDDLTAGLPIQLYHPAFATFIALRDDHSDNIPEETFVQTARLFSGLSELVVSQDAERTLDVRSTLSAILGIPLVGVFNSDDTYQDFVYQVRTPKLGPVALAAPVMVEIQPEIGGNTDPTVQVSFSYRKYHSLPEVCTSDHFLLAIISLTQIICSKRW